MKPRGAACSRLIRAVWLLWCLLALHAAHAQVLELRHAQAAIAPANGPPQNLALELPYHWDRHQRGAEGYAVFDMAFDLPQPPAVPHGLLLHQVGNAYEVWLNGALLRRSGDMVQGGGADYAKGPRYLAVPGQVLRAGRNQLVVRIRADSGRRAGLAPPLIGPDATLRGRYQAAVNRHVIGSPLLALVALVAGSVALLLWWTQPYTQHGGGPAARRDPVYLYAGLADWSWVLRVFDRVVENPVLPWPWWQAAMVQAMAGWLCFAMMFCIMAAGWRHHRAVRTVLWVLLPLGGCAGWAAAAWHQPLVLTAWYAVCAAVFLPLSALYLAAALRRGASREHRLLAAALALNVLMGVRDLLVFRLYGDYGAETWQRYSAMLFSVALVYVAAMRFRAASEQVRAFEARMAARLVQLEAELNQSYQYMEQMAREQERASERTRILRDMHDGVGAHISAAMRQLQSGRASTDEVLETLRESLDHLKLSIDALHLPPGDVTALLANLRYRLEPRLKAAGIALQWQVDLLPPVAGLDGAAMRHLQFMLLEVLSNVLQHAHAHTLCIEARAVGEGVVLRLSDDGCGFDTEQPARKGLLALHDRAQAIGAQLALTSGPGGTDVVIRLPGGGGGGG
ncbi:MAG: histidine kinase [Acidovorax sp.]|uniref:sensor histidine kinase n=1 Tax=Acidovorax sp. TaxID=1872122 RepID=UPI0039E3C4BE